MKALVTGGAGFIGSNLVALLLQENIQVRVIDSLVTGYKENLIGLDTELIKGDARDFELVLSCCKDIDLIFHLAQPASS